MAKHHTMTDDIETVCTTMDRLGSAHTVTEIAEAADLTPGRTRQVLRAMERTGEAVQLGVALNGGLCWGLPKHAPGAQS